MYCRMTFDSLGRGVGYVSFSNSKGGVYFTALYFHVFFKKIVLLHVNCFLLYLQFHQKNQKYHGYWCYRSW